MLNPQIEGVVVHEYNERYCFDVDWFDHSAGLVRKYQLVYYPKDSQIEMVCE